VTGIPPGPLGHNPEEYGKRWSRTVHETGSNLVVMATHIPNVADHVWPSNGGRLATHTDASVFLVRPS
jgi:hypothetical protein